MDSYSLDCIVCGDVLFGPVQFPKARREKPKCPCQDFRGSCGCESLTDCICYRVPDSPKRCGTLGLELNVIGSEFVSWRVISAAGENFRILDDKIICRWVFCALNVLRLHFRTQKPSPNLTIFKKYSFV